MRCNAICWHGTWSDLKTRDESLCWEASLGSGAGKAHVVGRRDCEILLWSSPWSHWRSSVIFASRVLTQQLSQKKPRESRAKFASSRLQGASLEVLKGLEQLQALRTLFWYTPSTFPTCALSWMCTWQMPTLFWPTWPISWKDFLLDALTYPLIWEVASSTLLCCNYEFNLPCNASTSGYSIQQKGQEMHSQLPSNINTALLKTEETLVYSSCQGSEWAFMPSFWTTLSPNSSKRKASEVSSQHLFNLARDAICQRVFTIIPQELHWSHFGGNCVKSISSVDER